MIKFIQKYWFKRKGWRFVGSFPKKIERCIVAIAPHTSWLDYLLLMMNNKMQPYYITMVFNKGQKLPSKWILNRITHIDNTSGNISLNDFAEMFKDGKKLYLGFMPEGTIERNSEWDTTFYDLASQERFPMVLVTFDYRMKWIKYHHPFKNSIDKTRDIDFMKRFFSTNTGRNPQKGVFVD